MRSLFLSCLIIFSNFCCSTTDAGSKELFQMPIDTSGDDFFKKAEEFYSQGKYDSSSYYYNKAAAGFKAEERWKDYIIARNYSGINYRYLSRYEQSFLLLNDALEACLKKFGSNDSLLADLYNSLGSNYYDKGDFDKAFFNYNKSLQISLLNWGAEHRNAGRGYHNIGLIYYWTGDVEQALEYFNKALSIWIPIYGEKQSNIGNCYTNLANAYYLMDEYEKALEYDLKALEVWKGVFGEEHQYIAMSYANLAITNEVLGKYDKALEYDKKALLIREKIFGKDHPETAASISHIAKVFKKKGEYDKSREYYEKALTLISPIPDHPNRFEILIGSAELHIITGNLEQAMKNYDTVLAYTLPEALSDDFHADSINPASTKIEEWTAVAGKGDVFYKKYTLSAKNQHITQEQTADLKAAFSWYCKYSEILDKIRRGFKRETSKILIGKNFFQINSKIIKTALELYRITGDEKYKLMAFASSEKCKSAVLSDAIIESGAKKFGHIPDSLLTREKLLRNRLTYLNTKIEEAEEESLEDPDVLRLHKEIFDLNKEYDELIGSFEIEYPDYFRLKFEPAAPNLTLIRSNLLTKESSLLEYFIDDSIIHVFIITENEFEIQSVKALDLKNLVSDFRYSLQNIEPDKYLISAYKLYKYLIAPAEKYLRGKKKIYIVPDGILNYLPFEALLKNKIPQSADVDFGSLPYLIKDFEVSYHYSAEFFLKAKDTSGSQLSFIGFAPVFPDNESNREKINNLIDSSIIISSTLRSISKNKKTYSSLPESEREVKEIMKLFNYSGNSARIFTYSDATESKLKSGINKSTFIHFATHAFINETNPGLSGILFADNKNSEEDGILYSGEIYNLDINADLVVLSACESGLGKIMKGEGIIGLTRGFLYSGVNNIVVSLWQVADKSTSELMIRFYKLILSGKNYSSALREAKLRLIKMGYSYPLEWSPFILVGN